MTHFRANQTQMQIRENRVLHCIKSYEPVSAHQLAKLTVLSVSIILKHLRALRDQTLINVKNPGKKPPLYQTLPVVVTPLVDIPKKPTKISSDLTEEWTQYCQEIRINKYALMEEVLQNYLTTKTNPSKPKPKKIIPPKTVWTKIKNFFS